MTHDDLIGLLSLSARHRRAAVRRASGQAGLFALRTTLLADPHARVRALAARRLARLGDERSLPWLAHALADRSPRVRLAACQALAERGSEPQAAKVRGRLERDPVWWVRRAAALSLSAMEGPGAIEPLRTALSDPSWRVRLAAARALVAIGREEGERAAVLSPLEGAPLEAHLALAWVRGEIETSAASLPRSLGPSPRAAEGPGPLDDPDPAVVTARLERTPRADVAASTLVKLLAEPHQPLRSLAVRLLRASPDAGLLARVACWLDEPRVPYASAAARSVLDGSGQAADEAAAALVERGAPGPSLAWARARLGLECDRGAREGQPPLASLALPSLDDPWTRAASLDIEGAEQAAVLDPDPWVRRAAAAMLPRGITDPARRSRAGLALARSPDPVQRALAPRLLSPASDDASLVALLELGRDQDPAPRSAAYDALSALPSLEQRLLSLLAKNATSPSAVRSAMTRLVGSLGRVDLLDRPPPGVDPDHLALLRSAFAPQPSAPQPSAPQPSAHHPSASEPPARPDAWPLARPRPPDSPARSALGATGLRASPLALSGRGAPPERALARAAEAGVDTFFWEPSYSQLTRFLRRSAGEPRLIIAGSYHADARGIERDVDRARRLLRLDRIGVFLLFWARSTARLTGEGKEALLSLKERGAIGAVGFSTHLRDVAAQAIEGGGWDVLMTRHSAAHRGAEASLFPLASRLGVGVVSFGATCYGRLLSAARGSPSPGAQAPDCYRFSIETPGVSVTLCAPRSAGELDHDLTALTAPLDEARRAELIAHGRAVYAESQRANALLRQAPSPGRPPVRSLSLDWLDEPHGPPSAPVDDDGAQPRSLGYLCPAPAPPER